MDGLKFKIVTTVSVLFIRNLLISDCIQFCADNSFISPQFAWVKESENVTIYCKWNSTLKWKHNEGSIPKNAYTQDGFLHIKQFTYNNEGKYVCNGKAEIKYFWPKYNQVVSSYSIVVIKGVYSL